jgi:type IV pilus assembly protein PilC
MPQFKYIARSNFGKIVEGTIEAPVQRAALDKLRSQRMSVRSISEIKSSGEGIISRQKIFKRGIKSKDLVIFSRQLSTLVSAGVPIVQSLNTLCEQIDSPSFKKVITAIRLDIESGVAVADALKKHPEAFSELYVSMVRAGEAGGVLDTILDRLSNYLELAEELKGKVKGAMVYPLVIAIVASAITLFLLVGVIPTFKKIFSSFGQELPAPTQILINFSDFLRSHILVVIAIPIILVFAFRKYYRTSQGHFAVDKQLLKIPVLGDLIKKVAIAKFTRTLGTLIKSGVPIMQALETVAKTSGNKVIEGAIIKCRESIREGAKIADPLKKSGVFPTMVIQMISIGEESGNLEIMLTKIADFYDQEVDNSIKALTSLIEPIVICIMGVIVGTIVICMFLPIFEMSQLAGKEG